ncbi:MAG: bifunctional ADP-heptose synthase [Cytophagaceae bacterium]|jgi:rfaE bifunctional protein kinase chain/domain|nr:bifunctional ADP-heptose synthase [Cytophagaceae bacterium]
MAYSAREVFEAFTTKRVLIIGDVMIDSYLWGKVDRISPEAPVPIVQVQKREIRLGGAANVALNVQSLGATPVLCTVIGNDVDAKNFHHLLAEAKLQTSGIINSADRITTIKHRVMSGAHHMLRVDQEIDKELNATEKASLKKKIAELILSCDVIIFEDYDKGVISADIIAYTVELANKLGKPTVVDPKKRNFLHYHGVTLFKPNRKEMLEGLKLDFDLRSEADLEEACKVLQERMQVSGVLLTLSEKGVFINLQGEQHYLPAHVREISDVSGAGDTVVSTAALALCTGLSAKPLAALSNLAGGLVCEQVGVVPIDRNRLWQEAVAENILE